MSFYFLIGPVRPFGAHKPPALRAAGAVAPVWHTPSHGRFAPGQSARHWCETACSGTPNRPDRGGAAKPRSRAKPEGLSCGDPILKWWSRTGSNPRDAEGVANQRPSVRSRRHLRSPAQPDPARFSSGGAGRDRTDDLKLAKLALSQLSYGPVFDFLLSARFGPSVLTGLRRFAPPGRSARFRCPSDAEEHPIQLILFSFSRRLPIRRTAASIPPNQPDNGMVGLGRLELPTSRLSGVRSNHLSYRPRFCV